METVLRGDDINGDHIHSVAIHCCYGSRMSLDKWCTGLITQLLEIMHGQWLYHNYIVHDPVSGTIAAVKKEKY